jgi:PilZ domain-containing protein
MLQGRERQMSHTAPERRTMRRFDMRLPAAVNGAEAGMVGLLTETQNVSARGVFFYLDQPLPEGSQLEMVLTFPPHITLTDAVRVRFRARVVRVETPLPSSRVGIAAIIEDYEFLRSTDEQAVE